jgi:hypothetical protein
MREARNVHNAGVCVQFRRPIAPREKIRNGAEKKGRRIGVPYITIVMPFVGPIIHLRGRRKILERPSVPTETFDA